MTLRIINNNEELNLILNKREQPETVNTVPTNTYDKVIGTVQALIQGATIGQASHISGATNELANLPKKLYKAKNLQDFKTIYKNLGKDYVTGREKFKKDYKQFSDNNKGLAVAAEILGGLGAGGTSGILKGLVKSPSVLKNILNGATTGAVTGSMYGASNTEGKGIDLQNMGMGAVTGGVLGAALPTTFFAAKKAIKYLKPQVKDVIETYKEAAKNNFTPHIDDKGKLSSNTVAQQIGNNDIPSELLNIAAKHSKDKKFQKEVLKSNFGENFEVYRDNLHNDLKKIIPNLKEKAKAEYENIKDSSVELIYKDNNKEINIVNEMKKNLDAYKKNAISSPEKVKVIEDVNNVIKDIEKNYVKVNRAKTTTDYFVEGTIPENYVEETITSNMPFKQLQQYTSKLYDKSSNIKYFDNGVMKYDDNKGGRQAVELYDNLRKLLVKARNTDINKAKASKKYFDSMSLEQDLIDVFGKDYSNKEFINKILRENNVSRMSFIDEKLKDILKKYSFDAEYITDIRNLIRNVDLLKTSYILRNPTTKNAWNISASLNTSTDSLIKLGTKINKAINNPLKKYQNVITNIQNKSYKANVLTKPFKHTGYGNKVDTITLKNKIFKLQPKYTNQNILAKLSKEK